MMGLGNLFTRSTRYTVEDTVSGASSTFTVIDNIAPDWGSTAGYRGAFAVPGVWRSALLVSDTLGALPWHAYRERRGQRKSAIDPPHLLEQPNPPDVRVVTFSSWFLDLLMHGNSIGIYTARDYDGRPTACVPVSAENVTAKRVQKGDGIPLPVNSLGYRIGDRWYPSTDIFHVKGPCAPGSLRGMGVLENHLVETIGLAREQNRQARSVQNSGVPSGVLKVTDPDMTPDEAKEHKAAWIQSQRERTVAVLSPALDYTALAWNPSETQLLEARKFSLHDIALMFGLDVSWVGASQTSRVYSNLEMEALNLLKFSLGGWLARFEQTLSAALPRGVEVKANLDALLRPDTKTRYETHRIGIEGGFLTVDEARDLEDRPPLTPAQRAAQRPPSPAAPQSAGPVPAPPVEA